ncbi:MAG: hypothetical protein V1659_03820 [Candidatus Woesearchaeota archaeon]
MVMAPLFVTAIPVTIEEVKINGEPFPVADGHSYNLEVRRGDDLDIRLRLHATADVKGLQAEADVYGYEYSQYEQDKVSDTSKTFDMSANDTKFIDLKLEVPMKIDKKYTKLRIRIGDDDSASFEQVYELHIVGTNDEDAVVIKEVSFSPSANVVAGRAFTALVKVKNYGDDDLDDLTVRVAIPELGISDTATLDELSADEAETLEEFLLRIPTCADEGRYEVVVTVEFDEYESVTQKEQIYVSENEECRADVPAAGDKDGKTVLTVPQMQQVAKGDAGAVYPIVLSNTGSQSKTYTLSITGVSGWGTYRFDPSSVLVVPGDSTRTVYLYVAANDNAEAGEKIIMLNVQTDTESKQVPLTANIVESKKSSSLGLKTGLEIALIILVIILIIIGLAIGFSRLKGNSNDEEQYY